MEKSRQALNSSVPHFYDTLDRDSIKENGNKTNGFKREIRFLERDKLLKEQEEMPSSQSYNNSFDKTIEASSQKAIQHSRNNHVATKSMDKFELHTYYKELEKGYLNQDTPGPAAYSSENRQKLSNFRMSFNGSFTREKRNLGKLNELMSTPGPVDYDTRTRYESFNNIKGAGTIGKSQRRIDVKLMKPEFVKDLFTKMERNKY